MGSVGVLEYGEFYINILIRPGKDCHQAIKKLELKDRLKKFDLELAGDKSRIIPFGNNGSKEKFDFLGFTHVNGVSRKGNYKLVHHTSGKKSKAKKQAVKLWLIKGVRKYKVSYLINKKGISLILLNLCLFWLHILISRYKIIDYTIN